ncbi:hypothetical protein GCM10010420_01850 [Streptomyces glaucosporus]|uniref:LPXTG cell wall anchor domain-containing protein n=1 Tax=Streptomyces glaucosporus TaxID=284044 RepID=A0ABN3HLP8_9ACTN
MKLRHVLATAVASAVIAPTALLAAPAAYANEAPPSEASTGNTATEATTGDPAEGTEGAPEAGEAPGTEENGKGTGEAPKTGENGEASEPGETTGEEEKAGNDSPEGQEETEKGETEQEEEEKEEQEQEEEEESTQPPADDPSQDEGPLECVDGEEFHIDEDLLTGLSGLPSKVVAGSGFHNFKLNVTNKSDNDYRRVDLGVFTAQIDEGNWDVTTGHLTVQYQDPATGAWKNISLDENDEGSGHIGYTEVKAHTTYSVNLRLSVDASAPAGLGFAVTIGMYANDAGECVYSGDDSYYEFEVLKSGSQSGQVPDAKPQGGAKKPIPPVKPAGDNRIEPKGTLAETGSSSALPTIAVIGGVAMAVGAGAVFLVRRRQTTGTRAAL